MPVQIGNHTAFTLLEVMNSVKKTIEKRYQSSFWALAEIGKLNYYPKSGHCYPDLFYNEDGQLKATMRSIIWKSDFIRIREKFQNQLGVNINDGMKILFEAKIEFSERYGLTLRILDIDVSFALGELALQKLEALQKIKDEGIAEFNKKLQLPTIIKRIAIISVQTSKGLSDFCSIIDNNKYKLEFAIKLFPATMQGDKATNEISQIIKKLSEKRHVLDCIMIIRGGGGEEGLACYNSYELGHAIASCKVPVLTGIGHSTNLTVAEQMANIAFSTPSELANALVNHNKKALDLLMETAKNISYKICNAYSNKKNDFGNLSKIVKIKLSKDLSMSTQKYQNVYALIANNLKSFLPKKQNKFNNTIDLIKISLRSFVDSKRQKLKSDVRILTSKMLAKIQFKQSEITHCQDVAINCDPKRIIKKGFSITTVNGNTIYSASQIKKGDKITSTFVDGSVVSVVEQKN